MRISDWSSDVCSSDLQCLGDAALAITPLRHHQDIGFWIAEEAVLELSPVIDEGWRLAHYPVDLLCLVRGALQTGAGDPTERQRARILRPVGSAVAGGEQQQPRLHLHMIGATVRGLAVNGHAEGAVGFQLDCLVSQGDEVLAHAAIRMRSEEHTSELQSLMRISYAVFCLKQKKKQ